MSDIPNCGSCERSLFGTEDPCLCSSLSTEDVTCMLDYLAYVMEETYQAMREKAGFGQSVLGAELLKHAIELEGAADQVVGWVEELGDLIEQ